MLLFCPQYLVEQLPIYVHVVHKRWWLVRIVSSPANQIAATEAASFVANLFYEGADDPFPTAGMGGEMGKTLKPAVLHKGQKLFDEAYNKIIGKSAYILETSRIWESPQIQKGARAISKKAGHSVRDANPTAFEGIKFKQQNAEELINKLITDADVIVIRPMYTRIYSPNGQGLNILTKDGEFKGFLERSLESELKK